MVVPKFRAWHKELKRMMSVQIMWLDEGEISELELNDSLMHESIPVYRNEVVLMQSTGLVDINGQEIFEGDVVESTWFKGYDDCVGYRKAGIVVYRDGCFYIEYPGETEKGYFSISLKFAVSVEIIGNIYENPELVEGQS